MTRLGWILAVLASAFATSFWCGARGSDAAADWWRNEAIACQHGPQQIPGGVGQTMRLRCPSGRILARQSGGDNVDVQCAGQP